MTGYETIIQAVLKVRDLELKSRVDYSAAQCVALLMQHGRRLYSPTQSDRAERAFEETIRATQSMHQIFPVATNRENRLVDYRNPPLVCSRRGMHK